MLRSTLLHHSKGANSRNYQQQKRQNAYNNTQRSWADRLGLVLVPVASQLLPGGRTRPRGLAWISVISFQTKNQKRRSPTGPLASTPPTSPQVAASVSFCF